MLSFLDRTDRYRQEKQDIQLSQQGKSKTLDKSRREHNNKMF